ncbi:MAG TPA: glycosyltransferase family 39 protein [Gemmatimonadales bacterium]|nr:glycosyltransferase family 39 protein [Gemmatimonadales bacterium]
MRIPTDRWCRVAAALLALIVVGRLAVRELPDWRSVPGWEAYWIAQGLVRGEGFSLPVGHRWLFDVVDSNGYLRITDEAFQASAWADPVYTGILAALLAGVPGHYQLAALILNLGLLLLVFWGTYRLGERIAGPVPGLIAVVLLVRIHPFHDSVVQMTNTVLSGALIVVAGLALVSALERPTRGRAVALGLGLGVAVLAGPSAQFFVPAALLMLLLAARGDGLRRAAGQAAIVAAASALVVLPWTARNWLRFGELVPVRTGGGQIAFVGVVGAGAAVEPGRLRTRIPPPWRAESPRAAVRRLVEPPWDEVAALERFQLDYAEDVGPPGYGQMNEAERDAWQMRETRAFLREAPGLSARLALAKIDTFARRMNWAGGVACILAALAWLLARRSLAVLGLTLWVGAYLVPFLLIVPYYPRYRAPVEPLLVALAGVATWRLALLAVHLGRRVGAR